MFKIKLPLQQNALYKGQTATQFICWELVMMFMLLFHFTNTPRRHSFYIYRKGRFARNKLNVYPTKRIAWRKLDLPVPYEYCTLIYTDYSIGLVYTNDDIES